DRIDRRHASCRIGTRPSFWPESITYLMFRPISEIANQSADHRRTCALGDGMTRADKSRGPLVVAAQCGCGGKRNRRVAEREIVAERPGLREALANQPDRVPRLPQPNRQDRPETQKRT